MQLIWSFFEDKGIRATYYAKDDPEKTTVIVHKTDDAGKGLPGAKFALYKNKNCAASDLVLELGQRQILPEKQNQLHSMLCRMYIT
ncbi:MAG: hypothetical protein V8S36_00440 [Lachnospiraceae bacterium]